MCGIDLYHQGAPSLVSRLTYFDAAFVAWKRSYIEPKLDTFPRRSYFHLWEAERVSLNFTLQLLMHLKGIIDYVIDYWGGLLHTPITMITFDIFVSHVLDTI